MVVLTNWQAMHALADAQERRFTQAWRAYLEAIRARAEPDLIEQGRVDVDAIAPAGELLPLFVPVYTGVMALGQAELRTFRLPDYLTDADWAAIGGTISAIDGNTRAAIQQMLRAGLDPHQHPFLTAKDIRPLIGLTPRQFGAWLNYGNALTAAGRTEAQIRRETERYKNKLLRERAKAIAQTETMRALNMAQMRQWEGVVERGQLGDSARKVWITTPDDRLCERCRAMGQAEPVPFKEEFRSPGGDRALHPPLHTRCRCGMGLEIVEVDAEYVQSLMGEDIEDVSQAVAADPASWKPFSFDDDSLSRSQLRARIGGGSQQAYEDGLRYYQYESHILNDYLRKGRSGDVELDRITRQLDEGLSKAVLTEETILYRGADKEFYKQFKAGDTFEDRGFISTTPDRTVAQDFMGSNEVGVIIRIKAPAGTQGSYPADITGDFPSETEWLLPRGTQFRVDRRYTIDNPYGAGQVEVMDVIIV